MSTQRISKQAGYIDLKTLPKGPAGRALCRQCTGEVPAPRRSFCSDECIHHWQLKTNTAYVRQCVFERDKGVCNQCSTDTEALKAAFRGFCTMNREQQQAAQKAAGIWCRSSTEWAQDRQELSTAAEQWCQQYGIPPGRMAKSWWDADHIVPVAEGGGECDLANYQTLCLACHKVKTTAQAKRRALSRKMVAHAR